MRRNFAELPLFPSPLVGEGGAKRWMGGKPPTLVPAETYPSPGFSRSLSSGRPKRAGPVGSKPPSPTRGEEKTCFLDSPPARLHTHGKIQEASCSRICSRSRA